MLGHIVDCSKRESHISHYVTILWTVFSLKSQFHIKSCWFGLISKSGNWTLTDFDFAMFCFFCSGLSLVFCGALFRTLLIPPPVSMQLETNVSGKPSISATFTTWGYYPSASTYFWQVDLRFSILGKTVKENPCWVCRGFHLAAPISGKLSFHLQPG